MLGLEIRHRGSRALGLRTSNPLLKPKKDRFSNDFSLFSGFGGVPLGASILAYPTVWVMDNMLHAVLVSQATQRLEEIRLLPPAPGTAMALALAWMERSGWV